MSVFVTIQTETDTFTHFPHQTGTYATMCGLDGNDDFPCRTQKIIQTPANAKVNCPDCIAIWVHAHDFNRDEINWRLYNNMRFRQDKQNENAAGG